MVDDYDIITDFLSANRFTIQYTSARPLLQRKKMVIHTNCAIAYKIRRGKWLEPEPVIWRAWYHTNGQLLFMALAAVCPCFLAQHVYASGGTNPYTAVIWQRTHSSIMMMTLPAPSAGQTRNTTYHIIRECQHKQMPSETHRASRYPQSPPLD